MNRPIALFVFLLLGCSESGVDSELDAQADSGAVADTNIVDSVVADTAEAGDTDVVRAHVSGRLRLDLVADRSGLDVQLVGFGTTKTAADGAFDFDGVPLGVKTVIASVPSTLEGSKTAIVDVSGATTVPEMVFTPVGEIGGTATFGTITGNAGITVLAGSDASATTDDAGQYVLRNVPLGTRDLVALFPDWPSASTKGVPIEWRKRTVAPDLVLVKKPVASGELHGTVTVTGESTHEGVIVLASGTTSGAVTNTAGAWSIKGLADGEYTLTVTAPSTVEGSRTTKATIDKGKSVTVDAMTFTPLGTLKGKVTLGGATTGNAGITVWIPDARAASTNDAGEWEIRGARTGVSTISASKAGWGTKSISGPSLHWRETLTTGSMELAIDPSTLSTIAGRAKLPGTSAHEGTVVTVSGSSVSAVTAADGSYSLKVGGETKRTVTFKSADGRYNGSLEVVLVPGGSALWSNGVSLLPLPPVSLVRGTRIGRGRIVGLTASGDVLALADGNLDRITTAGVTTRIVTGALGADTTFASSDGRWVVYQDSTGLELVDTTTSVSVSLGVGSFKAFSEDQKSFLWQDATKVHVRSLTGGTSDLPLEGACVLSPTALWVACSKDSTVKLARADGSATYTFPGPTEWYSPRPLFTTDGRFFHAAGTGLAVVDLTATTPTDTVVVPKAFDVIRAPDGRKALILGVSGTLLQLHHVAEGALTAQYVGDVAGGGNRRLAAFSADSGLIAWAQPSSSGAEIWKAPTASLGSKTRVADLLDSPYVLYFMGNEAVAVQNLVDGFEQVLLSGTTSTRISTNSNKLFAFSPDTRKLATAEGIPTFRTVDTTGTTATFTVPGVAFVGAWSPDGARATVRVCPTSSADCYLAATSGTSMTPLGWPFTALWLSPTQALLTAFNPVGYPVNDDSLWLASFP